MSSFPDDVQLSSELFASSYHLLEDIPGNRDFRAQEESFLKGRPIPIFSLHGGPEEAAARIFYALCGWVKGPQPPRPFTIKPILPQLQDIPRDILRNRWPARRHKILLLIIICLLWAATYLGVLSVSISRCQIPGYKSPVRLSCVSRFW